MKTEIAVLGTDALLNEEILKRGAEIIKRGGLVAFPTETVYGLGANALDASAAEKIYVAKGRPSDNPLIIHLSNVDDAKKYAYVPDIYYILASAFLPGPLTVIMPKRDIVPSAVTGGLDTVAVRIPSHEGARRLIELSGVPIAAPSANLSGRPSPTQTSHVVEDMEGRVDMIIGGEECEIGLESTIIKLDETGATLLRPGKITVEMLREVLGEIKIDKAVTDKLAEGERPLAPGMKYRHYAPRAPLTLVQDRELLFKYADDKNAAFIVYDEDEKKLLELGVKEQNILTLGEENDTRTHASRLFALLRLCDRGEFEKIYAPTPKSDGLGLAVYNRIIKAAGYSVIKK